MSEITRICVQCGQSGPLEARYCPHCGYDSEASTPAVRTNQVPAAVMRAALPILAGAASLALRAGLRFLQSQLEQAATKSSPTTVAVRQQPQSPAPRRTRRVIHVRSAWAVGDANGVWRRGSSEHTIEIDE